MPAGKKLSAGLKRDRQLTDIIGLSGDQARAGSIGLEKRDQHRLTGAKVAALQLERATLGEHRRHRVSDTELSKARSGHRRDLEIEGCGVTETTRAEGDKGVLADLAIRPQGDHCLEAAYQACDWRIEGFDRTVGLDEHERNRLLAQEAAPSHRDCHALRAAGLAAAHINRTKVCIAPIDISRAARLHDNLTTNLGLTRTAEGRYRVAADRPAIRGCKEDTEVAPSGGLGDKAAIIDSAVHAVELGELGRREAIGTTVSKSHRQQNGLLGEEALNDHTEGCALGHGGGHCLLDVTTFALTAYLTYILLRSEHKDHRAVNLTHH